MSEKIMSGSITLKYTISAHNIDGRDMYEWVLANGTESYSLFLTAEEAIEDVRKMYA